MINATKKKEVKLGEVLECMGMGVLICKAPLYLR